MAIARKQLEDVYAEIRHVTDTCDWKRWPELFAEGATFVNSAMEEPVRGKEALRSLAAEFPTTLVNHAEWVALDGNRIVMGWNERMAPGAPVYRGVSIFVIDDDGLATSYEGVFDPAVVAAAWARPDASPTTS